MAALMVGTKAKLECMLVVLMVRTSVVYLDEEKDEMKVGKLAVMMVH